MQAVSFERGFPETQGSIVYSGRGRDASPSKETDPERSASILLTHPSCFARHWEENIPLVEGWFQLEGIVLWASFMLLKQFGSPVCSSFLLIFVFFFCKGMKSWDQHVLPLEWH